MIKSTFPNFKLTSFLYQKSFIFDTASVAQPELFEVSHYTFNWNIDMKKNVVEGTCCLRITRKKDTAHMLLLDVFNLNISKVIYKNEEVPFEIKEFSPFGQSLMIVLPSSIENNFEIIITYSTGETPCICWLDSEQTAGKKYPYMYTQGQACLNRGLFPSQDTPSVRCTYSATVTVEKPFNVVMAAKRLTVKPKEEDNNYIYEFELKQTIPSYLVAMAVGNIVSADIGPRSKVWTEPEMIKDAQNEFNGITEKYISTGEKLFGKYLWEEYDLLVMPPSFPYGGMENPRLTFVTPCLLVGDHSLCDTVAHEISHSWFGNLVTNANWGEFWLNEGFTMFAQRRIVEEVSGCAVSAMEAVTGQNNFLQLIEFEGESNPLTRLRVIIDEGVDPDDTYNYTPYEKGYVFVCYLRYLIGDDKKKFDDWLKVYVYDNQFKSIIAEDMFEHYLNYFPEIKQQKLNEKPGFEFIKTWLEKPGLPPFKPDLSVAETLSKPAEELAKEWIEGKENITKVEFDKWHTYQQCHFLDTLVDSDITKKQESIRKICEIYKLDKSHNAETRLRWCSLIIKSNLVEHFDDVTLFLSCQGKQKYLLPLYTLMMKGTNETKTLAKKIYNDTKKTIHLSVQRYIEQILNN